MKLFGRFCIILGLLFGIAAIGWYLYNDMDEQRVRHETETALEEVQIAMENAKRSEVKRAGSTDRIAGEMQYVEADGYRYIGYIHIPVLNLSLPIQSDWDMKKLKVSPCRYSGSIAGGDLIIAGHNYRAHFSPIKTLPEGTQIIFEDVLGNRTVYRVSEIQLINREDVPIMLGDSDKWDLTLFTCNYGGRARVTLRCVLEDQFQPQNPLG